MPFNVLSLFDGMSCGRQALDRAGICYDTYYSSEVDKHAIKVTAAKFPDSIQLGDVRNIDVSALGILSMIIGGSPCQSFSFAGKMNGMTTKESQEILSLEHYLELKQLGFEFEGQSYLFWEFIRILTDVRKYNPDVLFLLENVKMQKKWQAVLTKALGGVEPVEINSALVCAQNRKRLYWTNIGKIPQPKDKGIYLKDILETEVDEKYNLSEVAINRIIRKGYSQPKINPNKTGTLNTKNNSGQLSIDSGTTIVISDRGPSGSYIVNTEKVGALSSRPGCPWDNSLLIKTDIFGKPKQQQHKASCLTAGAHSGGNHSDMDVLIERKPIQLNPSTESNGSQPYQQNRVYDINGIMPTLQTHAQPKILEGYRIRRLTPIECCCLQTVADDYFFDENGKPLTSDTQMYRMLGNGWTIEVISHIFSFITQDLL